MATPTEVETALEDRERYRITRSGDDLVLEWKQKSGLALDEFRAGVAEFAALCIRHRSDRALIDAGRLHPDGTTVGWVSGRRTPRGEEEYLTWWLREIVPRYYEAGISSLAVAIGDPDASGEGASSQPCRPAGASTSSSWSQLARTGSRHSGVTCWTSARRHATRTG